jgi:hypothetical protein
MNYSIWILLLLTVNVYGQTAESEVTARIDWCLECHHHVIYLLKVIDRGDSTIKAQANTIRILQQDTIKHEHYIVNNTYAPQDCEDCPTKRQKTVRWLERVAFIGGIIAVVIIRVKDE